MERTTPRHQLIPFLAGFFATVSFAVIPLGWNSPTSRHAHPPHAAGPQAPGSSLEGLGQLDAAVTYVTAVEVNSRLAVFYAQLIELDHQTAPRHHMSTVSHSTGNGSCAIPAYICARESGFDPTAQNPTSTASGKYQALDTTWSGYAGYAHAKDAPEAVQDQWAAELWNGGRGCSHWSAC